MYTPIKEPCCRCHKPIEGGFVTDSDGFSPFATAGFYDVRGFPWKRYAKEGEKFVCDCCMWSDEGYVRDYGVFRP